MVSRAREIKMVERERKKQAESQRAQVGRAAPDVHTLNPNECGPESNADLNVPTSNPHNADA